MRPTMTTVDHYRFAFAADQIWKTREAMRAFPFNAAVFARVMLRWTPDAKQTLVLESGARRVVLNCSRQWGKTTLAATKIVHVALMRPGSLSVLLAENLDQTAEIIQKIDRFLDLLWVPTRGEAGKQSARVLPNGSRIVGLAAREAAARGYTADFVFLDEAARIADDVIDAVMPLLAVRNGDWWMASTPLGRRGRFYEQWEYGGADVLKVSATWQENPRLAPGFVENLRRERGDAYIQQEFECQFVENGEFLLTVGDVQAILVPR